MPELVELGLPISIRQQFFADHLRQVGDQRVAHGDPCQFPEGLLAPEERRTLSPSPDDLLQHGRATGPALNPQRDPLREKKPAHHRGQKPRGSRKEKAPSEVVIFRGSSARSRSQGRPHSGHAAIDTHNKLYVATLRVSRRHQPFHSICFIRSSGSGLPAGSANPLRPSGTGGRGLPMATTC